MLSQEQPEDVQSLPFTAEEPRPTDTDGGGGSRRLTKSESSALSDPRGPSVVIRTRTSLLSPSARFTLRVPEALPAVPCLSVAATVTRTSAIDELPQPLSVVQLHVALEPLTSFCAEVTDAVGSRYDITLLLEALGGPSPSALCAHTTADTD